MTYYDECEYYSTVDDVCNVIDYPALQCEQWWYCTFGCRQKHAGKYVKVRGTFNSARKKMFDKYGAEWSFQYSEEEWEKIKNDPDRWWPMEEELEVIV